MSQENAGLITRRSRVQIPPPLLTKPPLMRGFRWAGACTLLSQERVLETCAPPPSHSPPRSRA
jgi:hypothetical protein